MTAAEELAAEVARLARSPMVAMSGHGGILKKLVDYLGEQQRRISQLEDDVKRMQRGHWINQEGALGAGMQGGGA